MVARDPHRFVNELDEVAIERLISRLESRAKDKVFTSLFDKYASRLTLPPSAQVLEVGCGTGAMLRFFASRSGFSGKAIGVDQSLPFIEAASKFAQLENVSNKIDFQVGDAHRLDFPPASFDVVIANTLISHVTQPTTVLEEMARVVRPGGTVAIFDGDYASLTYAMPDHDFGHKMDVALAKASFNNPRIMRDLPRLLQEFGLEMIDAWGDAIVEIGKGSYFKSFAETYAPYVSSAGLLSEDAVNSWLTVQRQAMEKEHFLHLVPITPICYIEFKLV
ncbi:MAG: methyltransferase domain-containing protein [Candidatus Thiodiazotropha sp. (ex Lucinoma borealis)]|nr:methyltransferase domain-containing protein [Candidatus Thiodiazotropha sp. (ex Lucinoma borealis)]